MSWAMWQRLTAFIMSSQASCLASWQERGPGSNKAAVAARVTALSACSFRASLYTIRINATFRASPGTGPGWPLCAAAVCRLPVSRCGPCVAAATNPSDGVAGIGGVRAGNDGTSGAENRRACGGVDLGGVDGERAGCCGARDDLANADCGGVLGALVQGDGTSRRGPREEAVPVMARGVRSVRVPAAANTVRDSPAPCAGPDGAAAE